MGGSCFGCDGLNDEAESQPLLRQSSQPQGRSMTASSVSLGQGMVNCNQQPQPLPQPLPVSLMQMHLDADRDGVVDAAPANYGDWQWGAGAAGGIVMVRTRTHALQNASVLERCELSFRWTPGPEPRAGWRAELTLEPADRLLLYPDKTPAAVALVLQHGGVLDIGALPGADAGAVSLWMQAADYGVDNQEASWRVRLRFRFVDANGGVHNQNAQLRIAPWIMAGDLDPTQSVFGVGNLPLADYALELSNFVVADGAQFRPMPVRVGGFNRPKRKPYVRDVMKSGFSHAPHHQHLVFQQQLDVQASYPLGNGVLYEIGDSGILSRPEWADEDNGSSQNNGGNLLLSPPDDNYPYGRIIYGQRDPDFLCNSAPFYARQRMQAPIRLDSSWLKVGHVDEYLSFVPHVGADWPWKVLMMDPWLGYALAHAASARPAEPNLDDLCDTVERLARQSRRAGEDFATLLQRCEDTIGPALNNPSPAPAGVVAYAASPPPPAHQNGKIVTFSPTAEDGSNPRTCQAANFAGFIVNGDHAGWFNMVAGHLAADRATLLRELGRVDEDVIGMPVLLWVENAEHRVMTATADSVNMLVLRQGNGARCLVPKPFGPVCADTYLFEHYTDRKLVDLGLTVTFVNDWVALHCDDGEVHCGTNQIPVLNQLSTRPDATAADRTWWLRAPT